MKEITKYSVEINAGAGYTYYFDWRSQGSITFTLDNGLITKTLYDSDHLLTIL